MRHLFKALFIFYVLEIALVSANATESNPDTKNEKTALDGTCRFSLHDSLRGHLYDYSQKNDPLHDHTSGKSVAAFHTTFRKGGRMQGIDIDFKCENIPIEEACRQFVGLKFVDGQWQLVRPPADAPRHTRLSSNPVIVPLDRDGLRGALQIRTDASGAMKYRGRWVGYCLSGTDGVSIYGGGLVNYPPFDPAQSTEQEIIELIKSVRFRPD